MRLSGKVARLERRSVAAGVCPVCGGRGSSGLKFWMADRDPEPVPEGCEGCGKVGENYTICRISRAKPPSGWPSEHSEEVPA